MLVVLALTLALAPGYEAFPAEAPGLATASPTLGKLGRQFARAETVATVVAAAAALAADPANPGHVLLVADVGRDGGGRMPPHATHRDGRTVDLLMPVLDTSAPGPARAAQFPHDDAHAAGYCARFDAKGRYAGTGWEGRRPARDASGKRDLCAFTSDPRPLAVDFAHVARIVKALDDAAAPRGLAVGRVIVAPEYVAPVLATDAGKALGPLAGAFVRRAVWTRHDDHIHVELRPRRSGLAPSPKAP